MKLNRNKVLFTLGVIIILASWVRMYNFHDWLFFKFDQSRDATLLSLAIDNGPGELPLLGPRATKVGDDYLRLGPVYYYMQYFSGVLFNSTKPDIFAYPDLFFSILVIPLFFIFLRLYFNRFHSLLLTALFSFSFLIIQYSRFSWNPNSVPFFMLLSFYGMLRMVNEKNRKRQLLWSLLWSLGLIVATQLHFFAFFSLSGISVVFLFFRFKLWRFTELPKKIFTKQMVKIVGIFLAILFVFYTPVIVSDVKTDWSNTKNFFGAFSEKPKDKTLYEKVKRNFREQAKGYFLVATSFDNRSGHKADPLVVVPGLALIFSGLFFSVYNYRKKQGLKRDFNCLLFIWIGIFFIVSIPMSYQLRPRFFVIVFPVVFIIMGLWFDFFKHKVPKLYIYLTLIGFLLFLLLNVHGTRQWFGEMKKSANSSFDTFRTHILKKDDGVSLNQLEGIRDYLLSQEGDIINYYSKPEYELPIEYLLKQERAEVQYNFIKNTKDLEGKKYIYAITSVSGGAESIPERLFEYGSIEKTNQFGQLEVHIFIVDKNKVIQYLIEKNELEEIDSKNDAEADIEEDYDKKEKTPRLFWKNIFYDEDSEIILKKE